MNGNLFNVISIEFHSTSSTSSSETMVWIAKLGGFLGRKNDGELVAKSFCRGLKRLQELALTLLVGWALPAKSLYLVANILFCESLD